MITRLGTTRTATQPPASEATHSMTGERHQHSSRSRRDTGRRTSDTETEEAKFDPETRASLPAFGAETPPDTKYRNLTRHMNTKLKQEKRGEKARKRGAAATCLAASFRSLVPPFPQPHTPGVAGPPPSSVSPVARASRLAIKSPFHLADGAAPALLLPLSCSQACHPSPSCPPRQPD